jgi:ring-1,2-phenylacetyl-CoA epoxidase subunit PaaC
MSTAAAGTDARAEAATRWMLSMVGSLADNKAALGRRYGEWAVSAPTLESAVAAAAMAQDELGHARSTYPLLGQLDPERSADDEIEGGRNLRMLDGELPDWETFVAANVLVDGMLTTFVGACVDSSFEGIAQRARKILQEEGSHRVHAEAWAKRLCRAGDNERDGFVTRLEGAWAEVSRWPGPADEQGCRAAIEVGMVAEDAAALRATLRAWLTELLAGEHTTIRLEEPEDWSRWDAQRRRWSP